MYTGGVSKYMMDRRQLDDTFGESCRHAGLATTYWPEFDHTLMSPADRDRVLSSVGDWCEKFKVPAATSRLQIGRAHVELPSLMRISYAVFCLKKNNKYEQIHI